jgi:TonB-linked SusC/RagA family outer membrane protein
MIFKRTVVRTFFMLLTIAISSSFAFAEDTDLRVSETEQAKREITGTVIDGTTGESVAGASIVEKGTTNGTTTDADGKFFLPVSENAVLRITYIGYVTQEIAVGSRTDIRVTLSEDVQSMEEVVVIGYGTVQRKNFTGSVSTVNVANSPIAFSPRTNAMDMLRGTVTGANVGREKDAGSSPDIEVHGQKSIKSSSANPLVVLDGVIYMGSWREIDPATIESMSLLKDATSLAAYGSQAANGVIMITTKKGKLGKPVISFESSLAIAEKAMASRMVRPDVYVERQNIISGGDAQTWMSTRNYEQYQTGKTTDWWDFSTRTGITQNYSLSVSGATERLNYYASLSHTDQKGIVIGDNYKREALTIRLQNDITSWLQAGVQVNYSYNNYDGVRAGAGGTQLSPYAQPYRPDGKSLEIKLNDVGGSVDNPLWASSTGLVDDYDRYATTLLKGHMLVRCPWINGLSYRFNASRSEEIYEHDRFYHEGYYIIANTGEDRYSEESIAELLPRANGTNQRRLRANYVLDNILNYTAQFDRHFVDVTAVYTRDEYTSNNRTLKGTDFEAIGNTILGYDGLAYASIQTIDNIAKTRKANIGYLGRVSYNYDDRYHLTASVRRDGSTVFGADKKWGVFPAFGLAWTASRENFMKNVAPVSYLKVKASWGKNGNQSLDPYGTLSTISLGQTGGHGYLFDNSGITRWAQYVSAIGNPALGWETTSKVNAGFDIGLWKDRVSFEFDAYRSQTTEQIFDRTIPVMNNGSTSVKATMGQVNNTGVTFTLNTVNIEQKNFRWSSMLNFYLNRNKLVDLYGDGKDDISNSLFLGKSLGVIYGYKVIGIVQEEDTEYIAANNSAPGNPKFANLNGSEDGKITVSATEPDDRTILGYNKENFTMNMAQTVQYGNWELYALFTGVFSGGGYGMYENSEAYTGSAGLVNRDEVWWTPENRSNTYPRLNFTGGNYKPVMAYGYVRLQDLNLSYAFRQQSLKDLGIHRLQAYVSVKNLFTLTDWVGGDPEVKQKLNTMLTNSFSPLQKTVLFGLSLSF